jgi:hypothetical protein
VKIERSTANPLSPGTSDPSAITFDLLVSGTLRGTGEAVNEAVAITLRLAQAGHVDVAEAVMDPAVLQLIGEARVRA